MEARIPCLFDKPAQYTVLKKFPGSFLKDLEYEPLFEYFIQVDGRLY